MKKEYAFLGYDPGKKGWAYCIDEAGNELMSHVMPKREDGSVCGGDICKNVKILKSNLSDSVVLIVFVEDVHADPKFGTVGNFSFGRAVEAIHTALECADVEFQLIIPQRWQKVVWEGNKAFKDEKGKNDTKSTTQHYIQIKFPDIDLRATKRSNSKPHDGKIDAMAIAEYGRIKYLQKDLID